MWRYVYYLLFMDLFKRGKKEYGDYQCENVLSIWHQLRNNPESDLKKPTDVGEEIKKHLENRDDMIKEVSIHDIGIVTFKLSGKWMAENIHKMLRDADEMRIPPFRRTHITAMLIRMLKYSKVDVTVNKGFSEAGDKKKAHDEKDEGFGNASKDLSVLWYGLEKEKANWIVYVTPVQQQEYIEMCIAAARHAGWLPKDRLADCTVDFIHLVKEEGNTLRHLLKTRDEIRSFTTKFREDIDELKKASELTLGKAEVWEEGSERVLGLHLLMFTEVLKESCLSILPHILCEYVYDLSVKFGRCLTSKVGSVVETTTLLLFEATAVLEDVYAYEADVESDKKKAAVSGATEHTFITPWPNPIARDPLKILNPRFEPISISLNVTTDYEFKKGKMFGHVSVSDTYGLLSDSWWPSYEPDCGHISLFDRDWCNSIDVINYELLYLGNPGSRHSVPFSSSMEISMELIITTMGYSDALHSMKIAVDAVLRKCGFYMALLYEHGLGAGAIAGDIPLRKSLLAVPNESGSLIIEAKLMDAESGETGGSNVDMFESEKPARPKKKTADGLVIYSEEELGFGKPDAGEFNCFCNFLILVLGSERGIALCVNMCASLDGDADRFVYFTVISNGNNKINLVDGDKILSLFALFIKDQLSILIDDKDEYQPRVGVVQTAYANGASTKYLNQLGLEKKNAAKRLWTVTKLINQVVGDALSGLLLVEAILQHMGWSVDKWNELYHDLPSRQLKVRFGNKNDLCCHCILYAANARLNAANSNRPPQNVVSSSSALANSPAFVCPSRTPTSV
ncbi:arginine--tRNA ligase, chloroplastic/mitochondrial, partial [Tanacetum coccineum]